MSQTQVVQARVNREIKAQAADALAAMGLSVSDAIRILLTKVARENQCLLSCFHQMKLQPRQSLNLKKMIYLGSIP